MVRILAFLLALAVPALATYQPGKTHSFSVSAQNTTNYGTGGERNPIFAGAADNAGTCASAGSASLPLPANYTNFRLSCWLASAPAGGTLRQFYVTSDPEGSFFYGNCDIGPGATTCTVSGNATADESAHKVCLVESATGSPGTHVGGCTFQLW